MPVVCPAASRCRSRCTWALALAVLGLTVACGSAGGSTDAGARPGGGLSGGLRIVTTVAPITSIAAGIGGDRVHITGVVPEGTNSHTFEPPPSAARVLSTADVVLINGLKLEDPTRDLAEENQKDGADIVEIATSVLPATDYIYDFSFPRTEGKPNPHLWTDPTYAIKYAAVIKNELVRRDQANGAYYEANYAAFEQKATALSDALKADQQTIPDGRRELLTYHDAYAYFARTYGWKVIGAVQPKDFEDPTPKEIISLIRQVKREKVPTIFGSEVFPSKVLEQIGRESGARYEDTLRDDDLPGKPGDADHSWLGLMRYDFVTMVTGLGGSADSLTKLDIRSAAPDKATYPQ
jgi:ABC-type Zn uptake system ZnuABC Zn-binding protein ZnuA